MEGLCADTDTNKAEVPNACLHQNCPLTELLDFLQWKNFEELVQLQYGCKLCGEVIFKSARLLLNHIQLSHWESVQKKGHCTTTEKPTSLSPPAKGDDEASVPHSDSEDGNKGSDVNVQQVCDWLELLDGEPGQQQDGASSTQLDVVKTIKDEQATTASESADAQEIKSNASDVTDIYQQQPSGESDLEVTPKKPPKKVRAAKKVYKRKTRARNKKPSAGSADDDQSSDVQRHVREKRPYKKKEQKDVECHVCSEQFRSKTHLLKHFKAVHPHEKYFRCQFCDARFAKKREELEHRLTHKEPVTKEYRCTFCEKLLPDAASLRHHREEHRRTGFQCHICNHVFNREDRLKDHINIHKGIKPYSCPLCQKTFSTRNHSLTHKQMCGKPKSKTGDYVCEKCGKCFILKFSLLRHELFHANIKPYKCNVCQKAYSDSTTLRRHKRVHTQEVYVCTICGRHLRNDQTLRVHMATVHLGLKPHQCSFCGRAFAQKDVMQAHERTHTDEKPYICNKCGFGFRNRATFHAHKKKHANLRT